MDKNLDKLKNAELNDDVLEDVAGGRVLAGNFEAGMKQVEKMAEKQVDKFIDGMTSSLK